MATRRDEISLGEFYHIYSRGVDKRLIFLDLEDRRRFIRLLYLCNGSKPIVYKDVRKKSLGLFERGEILTSIGAYCLMPNHFHFLLKESTEGGIVRFMAKLLTAYSSYFNRKYDRTGALFGSNFKSSHLDTDEYLKYIYSYIHLNPLKIYAPQWKEEGIDGQKVINLLNEYRESSFLDYAGREREESLILNRLAFPEYFSNNDNFVANLLDWVNFDPNPFDLVVKI